VVGVPRRRWIPDGYVQPPSKDEVHVFVAKVVIPSVGQPLIFIPKDIARALGLTPQTVVEVAIRVVDEEYARREYGYVPQDVHSKPRKERVTCPVCGRPGRIALRRTRGQILIAHRMCDGFDKEVWHYVSKYKHSDWLEAHRHLIEGRGRS
jgi:bifunctional DNA-binding transcriptional regulator/antitoxin component of YhaV-PrlF toxin-antitoxin module